MKKQTPVYSFDVTFTGKQAKAIEAVAKAKGITPEAMVRQAVRDALDRANGKSADNGVEAYLLKLVGNRSRLSTLTAAQRQALEKRLSAAVQKKDEPDEPKVAKAKVAKAVKPRTRAAAKKAT